MRTRFLAVPFAAALVVAAASLQADDIDLGKTIDSAKQAIADKKYGRALEDLQSVMAEVVRLRMETLKTVFPDAPAGWTAGEAEGQGNAFAGGMMSVATRAYTKDEAQVRIELTVGNASWFSMIQAAVTNPMLAGPGMKQVTVKGRKGMLDTSGANEKRFSLQLILNGQPALLKIDGNGITRDDVEKTFGGAFDFDKAEKIVQQ